MVKFGGHVEAIREGDLADAELYLIPYNEMKTLIFEDTNREGLTSKMANQTGINVGSDNEAEQKQAESSETNEEFFVRIWKVALKDSEEDFRRAREEMWQTIFAGIADNDDTGDPLVRGAHPGNAIKTYVDMSKGKNSTAPQELLVRMKEIYRAESINSEGLRKLVKKYDKSLKGGKGLSSKLLPLLYTSSLYTGQNMMQEGIGLLRELIAGVINPVNDIHNGGNEKAYNDGHFQTLIKRNSETRHQESIDIRKMEFDWLKSLVRSIPDDDLLPRLVAHRGFHHIKDRNDKRPVENSLSAYEMAWTSGIELCECDIALTKDEKLVLAHDENFERLSLDTRAANSKRKVGDLTFKELISMPLTNGVRPPLLIDVLRSASAISEKSKLIIEIKPGNEVSAFALARLLIRHPDLRSCVAMIMSFDAATMHRLRAELDRAALPDSRESVGDASAQGLPLHTHRRVTSYDHFGTMSTGWLAGMGITGGVGNSNTHISSSSKLRNGSIDMSSIGLSISQTNLNNDDTLPIGGSFDRSSAHNESYRGSFCMPKLMLLTVADPPNIACELKVKHDELHRVDHWLVNDETSLDGVYLQFEKAMMTPDGAACLRQLSQRFLVGIWGYAEKDPDNFETFEWLVKQGNCSFVNSDLPKHFRKELLMKKERLPPRQ
jgi:glycerophosphoryl diester phosphodiesterase